MPQKGYNSKSFGVPLVFGAIAIVTQLSLSGAVDPSIVKHALEGERYTIHLDADTPYPPLPSTVYIAEVRFFKDGSEVLWTKKTNTIKQNTLLMWADVRGFNLSTNSNNRKFFKLDVIFPEVNTGHAGHYQYEMSYAHLPNSARKKLKRSTLVHLVVHQRNGPSSCQDGWARNGESDTCLKIFLHEETWADARNYCIDNHEADLVVIDSKKSDSFLTTLMGHDMNNDYWVGLSDIDHGGSFQWLDSKAAAHYYNWATGEPKSSEGEWCVYKTHIQNGPWATAKCSSTKKIICERGLDATTGWIWNKYNIFSTYIEPSLKVIAVLVLFILLLYAFCYFGIKTGAVPKTFEPLAKTILGKTVFRRETGWEPPFIPKGGMTVVIESSLMDKYLNMGNEIPDAKAGTSVDFQSRLFSANDPRFSSMSIAEVMEKISIGSYGQKMDEMTTDNQHMRSTSPNTEDVQSARSAAV